MNKSEQTFNTERTNTDKSLVDEREKTNRSLNKAKGAAEKLTDEKVQINRAEADEDTQMARDLADTKRSAGHTASETKNEKITERRIGEERSRSDAAVELERTRVDIAIVQERESKSVIETKFLDQERQLTDKNLKIERTLTDSVVLTTSVELITEVEAHTKTKISLTTRDEFLAIVSHDLRNPIGAVSSCMDMLLDSAIERSLSTDTVNWLHLAKRNADSSLRLIGDILDMERMAEGKLELNSTLHEIESIIADSVENFVHAAALKNVTISTEQVTPCAIFCDRDRVLQVLSNLIGNALKYTPKTGQIDLITARTNNYLTVSVRDNGPGIPKEKAKTIFEKFTQLSSSDRTGLGLGLHISKMLVEAHDGNLWVVSTLGVGSTFSFRLPIVKSV